MTKHYSPLLLLLALAFAPHTEMRGQEVYNMVLASATRTVNSPTSNYTQTQIAQFKRTALVYLKRKALEADSTGVSSQLLDTQAYYLSEFLTYFFDEILKSRRLPDEKRKERITLFMDASVSNPLFGDHDEETTLSYITNGGELTPFSLDTDWEKAYAAVKATLK